MEHAEAPLQDDQTQTLAELAEETLTAVQNDTHIDTTPTPETTPSPVQDATTKLAAIPSPLHQWNLRRLKLLPEPESSEQVDLMGDRYLLDWDRKEGPGRYPYQCKPPTLTRRIAFIGDCCRIAVSHEDAFKSSLEVICNIIAQQKTSQMDIESEDNA